MKINKNILLHITLVLFCYTCAENIVDPTSNDQLYRFAAVEENLDIVTWNIEHFPKTHNTVTYLTDLMKSINVDIFALQEIESLDSLNALKNNLGDNWVAYRAPGDSYYGNLAYLINTASITPIGVYNVLDSNDELLFNYRLPYVLEFSFQGENFVLINVHLKCCGDGLLNLNDNNDEENLRYNTLELLNDYIETEYTADNLLIVGDFNDTFEHPTNEHDVFISLINSNKGYVFTDNEIAFGSTNFWSYPEWPSHIDHIIISDEIYNNFSYDTQTLLLEYALPKGLIDYYNFLSDHRPLVITLNIPDTF